MLVQLLEVVGVVDRGGKFGWQSPDSALNISPKFPFLRTLLACVAHTELYECKS